MKEARAHVEEIVITTIVKSYVEILRQDRLYEPGDALAATLLVRAQLDETPLPDSEIDALALLGAAELERRIAEEWGPVLREALGPWRPS